MTVSGAVNGDVFAACLDQVLGPTLVPSDVVVRDNLPAHKVAGLAELVEARGVRLLYLPPYSPDFNPIELVQQAQNLAAHGPSPYPGGPESRHSDRHRRDNGARREKLVRPLWLSRTLT